MLLKVTKDGRNCEYINANFVRGARNESKYYIATQVSPMIVVLKYNININARKKCPLTFLAKLCMEIYCFVCQYYLYFNSLN